MKIEYSKEIYLIILVRQIRAVIILNLDHSGVSNVTINLQLIKLNKTTKVVIVRNNCSKLLKIILYEIKKLHFLK